MKINRYFIVTLVIITNTAFGQVWSTHEPTPLGTTAGSIQLIRSNSGITANKYTSNLWLLRVAGGTEWYTTRLHDGISVDNSFINPNSSRTWWQRDPYYNIQSWGDEDKTYLTLKNGNLGIGNPSPNYRLEVYGNGALVRNNSTEQSAYTSFRVQGADFPHGLEIDFFGQKNIPSKEWTYNTGYGGAAIVNVNNAPLALGTSNQPRLLISGDGNVGIGNFDPKAKLCVEGGIRAKEIKVMTDITVPDYVFEDEYILPTLSETETYIKENKHLPEMPSAADVKENGLDLAEMNLLLLKKVEELTLHMIEQEKKNKELEEEINQLKKFLK